VWPQGVGSAGQAWIALGVARPRVEIVQIVQVQAGPLSAGSVQPE
jgi:hypothetical protein